MKKLTNPAGRSFTATPGYKELASRITAALSGEEKSSGFFCMVIIENMAMLVMADGHRVADEIVTELADEVAQKLKKYSCEVMRVQSDQFALLAENCSEADMGAIYTELRQIIRSFGNNRVSSHPIHIASSIGRVVFPEQGTEADRIIDHAYINAFNQAGQDDSKFDEEVEQTRSRHQMNLANFIEKAIREKKLRLAFQPIIESRTGKIAHHECLLRVVGDNGSIESVGSLIPIAEKMGFIDSIDVLVLDMVIDELKHSENVSLSFNISNMTIGNKFWMQNFMSKITEGDVASRMMVEITETAANRDLKETAYFVASLQEAGCQVALDDFGSGYTSFQQIRTLSIDTIKIDGSLVRDLVDNTHNRLLVKSLVEFISGLGIKTVAECVDRGDTAKLLIAQGVDYLQGNYFGSPLNYRTWDRK